MCVFTGRVKREEDEGRVTGGEIGIWKSAEKERQ